MFDILARQVDNDRFHPPFSFVGMRGRGGRGGFRGRGGGNVFQQRRQ